jgi:hypothetical protein
VIRALNVIVPGVQAWRELAARLQGGASGVEKVPSHILLKPAKGIRSPAAHLALAADLTAP